MDVYTTVPEYVFAASLEPGSFTYHPLATDVGLVQHSALDVDLDGTLERLESFIPFDPDVVYETAEKLKRSGCRAVVCDISPLGITVAREAGLPSILIENFTWDWLYFDLLAVETARNPGSQRLSKIRSHIRYLNDVFLSVDVRICTAPAHDSRESFIKLPPIYRLPRKSPKYIRKIFNVPGDCSIVLISNGGVREDNPFMEQVKRHRQIFFIMTGSPVNKRTKNCVLLKHDTEFFHPDLVFASDAVIGKLGYSTVAEVYSARVPFGYITRSGSREAVVMRDFVDGMMESMPISRDDYFTGDWMHHLHYLIDKRRQTFREPNGAPAAAMIIADCANNRLGFPETYKPVPDFNPRIQSKTA